jgi:hypothetical protein
MLLYLQSKHATQILAIKHAVIAMCVCGEISYLVIAYEIGLDSNLREMGLAQVIYIYYTPYMEFRNMSGRAIHIHVHRRSQSYHRNLGQIYTVEYHKKIVVGSAV